MAKVYKLTFYAVDPHDYYNDAFHLFSQWQVEKIGAEFSLEQKKMSL